MADILTIVDLVTGVSSAIGPLSEATPRPEIAFGGGQRAFLRSDDPATSADLELLTLVQETGLPAYAEVDADTREVQRLDVPMVTRVLALVPLKRGGWHVMLDESAARHVIRPGVARYDEMVRTLVESCSAGRTVLVTDDPDDHDIVDVREAPGQFEPFAPALHFLVTGVDVTPRISVISRVRAEKAFDDARRESCDLPAAAAACIPFLFPDNGCWARAHRMCELMAADGIEAGKIWVYGDLRVRTPNHPSCRVRWNWHVAPVVRVRSSGVPRLHVIDPAVVDDEVVTEEQWLDAMSASGAASVVTDRSIYKQPVPGKGREEFQGEMNDALRLFRGKLLKRARGRAMPPPYDRCSV